eukprot:652340-Pleurochrysis_carterae.AAC.2
MRIQNVPRKPVDLPLQISRQNRSEVANRAQEKHSIGKGSACSHDTARLVLDEGVVHRLKRTLGIDNRVKVHICIAKGAAGHRITANTNRGHRADSVEKLEEESLGDLRVQVANVQRSSGVCVHDSCEIEGRCN